METLGVDPQSYSDHSFRIGAATVAAEADSVTREVELSPLCGRSWRLFQTVSPLNKSIHVVTKHVWGNKSAGAAGLGWNTWERTTRVRYVGWNGKSGSSLSPMSNPICGAQP